MRFNLAVFFLLAANLFAQPTQSDRYKYAPLVSGARLWNMIRYLHPQVTGDSTEWDKALLAALPKIEAAHSDDELAVALDGMLATLHDPCTRIAHGLPGKGVTVQSFESDTMVIHAGNGDLSSTLGAGLMIKMGIPQTSHVVWDLRSTRMPFSLSTRVNLRELSQNGMGYAYREHSGYAPQDGSGLRRYFSSLQMVDAQPVAAKPPASNGRQVYLVDKDSAVPMRAIIDQINGRTAILSEDPPRDSQAGFTELVNVLGKVVAEVRVAEVRYPDGTTGFAPTRVVLNRGDEAVKASISAMSSGQWSMPGERPDFLPSSSGFRDVPYADSLYPSRELRMLAAIRLWGVLRYFDPYISQMPVSQWDDVLVELLPRFEDAKDAREYHLAVAEMAARSGDPACAAKSSVINEWFGPATPPFEVRFIEGQPVITRIFKPSPAAVGDVILKINDQPLESRIGELSRAIAGPDRAARMSEAARFLLAGKSPGNIKVTVKGKDEMPRDLVIALSPANQPTIPASAEDAIRLIDEHTGYVDIKRIDAPDVDRIFQKLGQTSAIIFDLRGYPRNQAMAIASQLGDGNQRVGVELFHNVVGIGSDSNIRLVQSELRIPRTPKPHYMGKTVALIEDVRSSLAGESAMYLKMANQTVLIGSTAFPMFSGYSTVLDVPGGIKVVFSGEMPRWPGGKLVYPEGVKPDVEVLPTLAGIREKRDEVLEAAVKYLKSKE